MRKLILGTVSVLALGIAGAALDYVADADEAVPSAEGNMPSTPGTSTHWINTTFVEGRYQVGTSRTSQSGPLQ